MPKTNIYEQHWQSAAAQARGKGYKIVELGWEQHVIIDESAGIVYRYPRHDAAAAKLSDEIKLLADVHLRQWPVKLPVMLECNEVFASYKYIPGEVLDEKTISSLSVEDFEQLGRQLGEFLALFHQLDCKIVERKQTSHSISLLEYYSERILNSSLTDSQKKASSALSELIKRSEQISQVVVHGDLHGLNIVIDPQTKMLVGVIDLSEMEIGDPHQDFRKLFMADRRLLAPAARAYQQKSGQHINEELSKLWAYVNEWANLCHFAEEPENPTYQRALQHLRMWNKL